MSEEDKNLMVEQIFSIINSFDKEIRYERWGNVAEEFDYMYQKISNYLELPSRLLDQVVFMHNYAFIVFICDNFFIQNN